MSLLSFPYEKIPTAPPAGAVPRLRPGVAIAGDQEDRGEVEVAPLDERPGPKPAGADGDTAARIPLGFPTDSR